MIETPKTIRIATFNVSLYGKKSGEIRTRLGRRDDSQAKQIASIVQTVRPDILLVNELDYETDGAPAKLLAENYFAVPQDNASGDGKLDAINYPYLMNAPSNTGIDSSLDLNNDGKRNTGNDAWGYGTYPGQYAMTVYSRFPIDDKAIRTFQKLRWSTMPGAIRPKNPETGKQYYPDEIWSQLRLSSKNHIDVPVLIGEHTLHVLASHPTPPVFDGPEDHNGARNHDEVEFWNRYLSNTDDTRSWLVDDSGQAGGLNSGSRFVIMGDLNADPVDGSGRHEAIRRLLDHPRTEDPQPKASRPGAEATLTKTADFGRNGFMRVDFVIPSNHLDVVDSGVFWPASDDARNRWIKATDHRLVWIEVTR
ncbi:MAG: endonuclease/exonuclease/phosphatase family protein [Planctomycetales bacterium]|nr:endonuclease/exonuclease/phosphatase family protein [Planctomycetales bacterium]